MKKKPALLEETITKNSIQFVKTKIQNLRSSHGWDHVLRVTLLSRKIAEIENADQFVTKISSILHDVAREIEDNSNGEICHAEIGSKIAYDFLIKQGLDEYRSNKIAMCINTHRFRTNNAPSSIEAKVLYDADKLDSIGAIGIGRAFLFSGEVGAKLYNPDIDIYSTKAYSEEDTAYREFIFKLQHIKNRIITPEGKRIAEGRHQFMIQFFNHLQSEIIGEE